MRRADGRAVARGAVDRVGRASTRDPRRRPAPSDGAPDGHVQERIRGPAEDTREIGGGAAATGGGMALDRGSVGVGVRTSSLRRFALLLRVLRSGDAREGNLASASTGSRVTMLPRLRSLQPVARGGRVTARSRAHSRARRAPPPSSLTQHPRRTNPRRKPRHVGADDGASPSTRYRSNRICAKTSLTDAMTEHTVRGMSDEERDGPSGHAGTLWTRCG